MVGGAWLERDFLHTLESLDIDGTSKNSLRHRDLLLGVDIEVIASVPLVRLQVDLENKVARASIQGLVAPVLNPQQHAVINRFGDLYAKLDLLFDDSVTTARFALD